MEGAQPLQRGLTAALLSLRGSVCLLRCRFTAWFTASTARERVPGRREALGRRLLPPPLLHLTGEVVGGDRGPLPHLTFRSC